MGSLQLDCREDGSSVYEKINEKEITETQENDDPKKKKRPANKNGTYQKRSEGGKTNGPEPPDVRIRDEGTKQGCKISHTGPYVEEVRS